MAVCLSAAARLVFNTSVALFTDSSIWAGVAETSVEGTLWDAAMAEDAAVKGAAMDKGADVAAGYGVVPFLRAAGLV